MAQGERSALQKLIRKKKKKGMSLAMIAELLEMDPKKWWSWIKRLRKRSNRS